MDLEKLAGDAEKFAQEHGGPGALAKDAEQLGKVASGDGSVLDKAKEAETEVKAEGLL
jgi:hypothetical protein